MTSGQKKTMWITLGVVLIMFIAFGVISSMTAGFTNWEPEEAKVNPNNLYSTVELAIKDSNTGDGIVVDVDEETGAMKFKGTATKDLEYVVGTVTLDKGTYTFNASDKASNSTMYITATAGSQVIKSDFTPGNTFDVAVDGTEFEIVVHIVKGTTLYNVDILPVIYTGDEAVDFYE